MTPSRKENHLTHENKELKPCPFCGSGNVLAIGPFVAGRDVHCVGCGATIFWSESPKGKEGELWNRRAPHPDGLREALEPLHIDGHQWSRRPCATCSKVTVSLGFDFGCIRYAKEKALAKSEGEMK